MFDLLPPNATESERAISESIARMADGVQAPLRDLWDPSSIPSALLPWLAWAYSVDDWNSEWSDAQKRAAIQKSVEIHRYKGTIGSVREALTALGIEITLTEWFNQVPEGDPYTFDIRLDARDIPIDQQDILALVPLVNATKNLRSHLGKITPGATVEPVAWLAAVTGMGTDTTVQSAYEGDVLAFLMMAAADGYAATEDAVDDLNVLINETLPSNNYW